MAIFIIGVEKLNNERYFRLYNSKVSENNIRDISEKDLTYLMRGNSNFKVQNAELKDGKIVGITGSLNKIENEICFTVVGAINENGSLAGYRFVDTMGNIYNMKTEETIMFLCGKSILNASVVNGSFIRGINWEIPVIEDKKVSINQKGDKHIYLHVDVHHINYVFSKDMTDYVKSQVPEEFVSDDQFLLYIDSLVYTAYVPEEIYKQFVASVSNKLRVHCNVNGRKGNMMEIQIPYVKKGFLTEFEVLKGIAIDLGSSLEVTLMCSNSKEREDIADIAGYYENVIWNIISDAKSKGMNLKKYFFLGSDVTVFGNMKGALLDYVPCLDGQLKRICQALNLKYTFNWNKSKADGKIRILDYVRLDTVPYGCIVVEMQKR